MAMTGGIAISDLLLPSEAQVRRIEPYFLLSHGIARIDDRRVIRGIIFSEGQMSDYKGAALMLDTLPPAKQLFGDKGCDADWLRQALAARGISACIPSKSNRKTPINHNRAFCSQWHKIENMFVGIKDWRRIHTRYDRCAHTFMSTICIAATVTSWL
ncbi:hypothetical protein ACWX0K_13165 [Nitrobacteraceae bacterium UC4446_H13]